MDKEIIIPAGAEHADASISVSENYDTINIDDLTIDMSTLNLPSSSYFSSTTMGGTGATGSPTYTINTSNYNGTWGSIGSIGSMGIGVNGSTGFHCNTNASFDGDVTIKGHSILKTLEKIENRLAILQEPDPKKLEKFAALKKAYDNYKMLERLIGDDDGSESR